MQLRYLQEVILYVVEKEKQDNGIYVDTYNKIKKYKVLVQTLEDEVSASIYGADINKMYRLTSPNATLEKYLIPKVNNKADNISKYFIELDKSKYKIKAVNKFKIDIERL